MGKGHKPEKTGGGVMGVVVLGKREEGTGELHRSNPGRGRVSALEAAYWGERHAG